MKILELSKPNWEGGGGSGKFPGSERKAGGHPMPTFITSLNGSSLAAWVSQGKFHT